MEIVLLDAALPLTTTELAQEINARRLYVKRDGSAVQPSQIGARARKHPAVFNRMSGRVGLAAWGDAALTSPVRTADPGASAPPRITTEDSPQFESSLLDPALFRLAGTIDQDVPDRPGLYAIRVRDASELPESFRKVSEQRGHDLLYIGIASQSLSRRFLGQELCARGHGTFFRSVGAILGYRPPIGSLLGRANPRNYKFSAGDNQSIIEWINKNLLVNWVEFSGAHATEEAKLIRKHLPLLNLQANPAAVPELSALRAECVRIANTPTLG